MICVKKRYNNTIKVVMQMAQKDMTEKILFDYDDVFADIVNVLLFRGEEVIKPDELQSQSVHSQYKAEDETLHEQERDVVKNWVKGGVCLGICGIENQTSIEPGMVLRVLGYDGASYRAEYLDKTRKTYAPVVTIVLNFSERQWAAPKTLKEVLDIPCGWEPYVNDYKLNVFDICWLTDEQLQMFKSDFGLVADFFVQKRRDKSYSPSEKTIQHVDEVLKLLSVMAREIRFEKMEMREGRIYSMCDVVQGFVDKGIEQGIKQGIERGIERGIRQGVDRGIRRGVIETLKDLGMPDDKILAHICKKFSVNMDAARKYLSEYQNEI